MSYLHHRPECGANEIKYLIIQGTGVKSKSSCWEAAETEGMHRLSFSAFLNSIFIPAHLTFSQSIFYTSPQRKRL